MHVTQQSKGGQATALKLRAEALARYYANPRICEHCGKVIRVPDGQGADITRRKRFCNHTCAARHNNPIRVIGGATRKCVQCNSGLERGSRRKFCAGCLERQDSDTAARTKGTTSRRQIAGNAASRIAASDRPKVCEQCAYAKHVEVAHVRAISDFPDSALVRDINSLDNLRYLCPNCHWEFDHPN